ncbi:DUF6207 family protein [Streptomyces coeruleorubidus]|uniref:DUF6207 family protein n=1 Tax=Streptomyces coeruleorubidus TaxID=116188 RepID=UPI0033FDCBE3
MAQPGLAVVEVAACDDQTAFAEITACRHDKITAHLRAVPDTFGQAGRSPPSGPRSAVALVSAQSCKTRSGAQRSVRRPRKPGSIPLPGRPSPGPRARARRRTLARAPSPLGPGSRAVRGAAATGRTRCARCR